MAHSLLVLPQSQLFRPLFSFPSLLDDDHQTPTGVRKIDVQFSVASSNYYPFLALYFAEEKEMGDVVEHGNSMAAPIILIIVTVVQFIPKYIEQQANKGSMSDTEIMLRKELQQLYKDASVLSQPSTFAQAAKLKRKAATKEKELAKYMEHHVMEKKSNYDPYTKLMMPLKVSTYILLTVWFWKSPVASIPRELVTPLGKLLSWKAGTYTQGKVMVGILPWLILCTRVSKLICGRFIN